MAALAASLAVVGGAALPAAAAPPTIDVVNLGDSFSAGIGSGGIGASPVLPGCAQGTGADHLDQLTRNRRMDLLLDAACAGMDTAQVGAAAQSPAVAAALGQADLVTVTMGGNDVSWTTVILACSTYGNAAACDAQLALTPGRIQAAAASAADTLQTIDTRTDGQVVLLGYPHLFDGGADHPLISAERIGQLNAATDALNGALAAAARTQGVTFADVTGKFAGHGADSADPWINLDLSNLLAPTTLHPTTEGYLAGYYPALRSVIAQGQLGR